MIKNKIMNSIIKCKEKNRFSVALLIEYPAQIHSIIVAPIYRMAIRFVITVAPQYDICPHGSTYPRNAVAIAIMKIVTPLNQVLLRLND